MISETELAAMEERCRAANRIPWGEDRGEDADFLRYAKERMPDLIREVRRLRAMLAAATEELQ